MRASGVTVMMAMLSSARAFVTSSGGLKLTANAFQGLPISRLVSPRLDVADSEQSLAKADSEQSLAKAGFAAWWDDANDEVSGRMCSVKGALPTWLRGRLVRNGPGRWQDAGLRSYTHAFDGLAKLVSFDISEDGVQFSTRFLRTDWWEGVTKGEMPPSVTTGPVTPPWSAVEGVTAALTGPAFDNTPVNLHRIGGGDRWVAVTDAPPLIEFDPRTLETRGRVDGAATPIIGTTTKFGVNVPGFEAFSTAHPQRHPRTGETLNYHLELRPVGGPIAHIIASSAAPGSSSITRRILGSVELDALVKNSAGDKAVDGIPYVHSFGVRCLRRLHRLCHPVSRLRTSRFSQ